MCLDLENYQLTAMYNIRGLIKIQMVLISQFFPRIIDSILLLTANLHKKQEHPTSYNLFGCNLVNGRAGNIIHVGVKYSVIIMYMGFWNTFCSLEVCNILLNNLILPLKFGSWFKSTNDDLMEILFDTKQSDEASISKFNSYMRYCISSITGIGLVMMMIQSYFKAESIKEVLTELVHKIVIPQCITITMMIIIQFQSNIIHYTGTYLGWTLSSNHNVIMLNDDDSKKKLQWQRRLVGPICFGVWISFVVLLLI